MITDDDPLLDAAVEIIKWDEMCLDDNRSALVDPALLLARAYMSFRRMQGAAVVRTEADEALVAAAADKVMGWVCPRGLPPIKPGSPPPGASL